MKKYWYRITCIFFVTFLLFTVFLQSCKQAKEKPLEVSLSKVEPLKSVREDNTLQNLRIAIAAVISPKETFILYKELLGYISEKIGRPVKLYQRETYEEVNIMVKNNKLDIALVCSGAYVDGHDEFGMELLVAPVAYGKSVYHSYIIVPKNSEAESWEDLRGSVFAFTDPMSNSGKLSPTYQLARQNETIENFFKKYIYTYSHDRSIEMVAHNLVDAAAVDGLIWEFFNVTNPSLTSRTKIIDRSEPYGIPPIVVPAGLDPVLKEELRILFLNIHKDEKGKKILEKIHIDKFTRLTDNDYGSVRKMKQWLRAQ